MKDFLCKDTSVRLCVCVCVRLCSQIYLLLLNNLISCLKDWCVHHLDAFSHFLHFLQELCTVPVVNEKFSVSVITHSY